MPSNHTRREVLEAGAATLGGLATVGTASAEHTPVIDVGVYREAGFGVDQHHVDTAVEAIVELNEQIDHAALQVHRHPETARIEPHYDDAHATIRDFEQALDAHTDHLSAYDIHLFLYQKTIPIAAEMGGAGFTVYQWGEPDAEPNYTYMNEGHDRWVYDEEYALSFVNVETGGLAYEGVATDAERIYKNTVIHELGHTFGLTHSEEKRLENDAARADDIVYDEPGTVIEQDGYGTASPMATWYADDITGSNDVPDRRFCGALDTAPVVQHTPKLSPCSKAEIEAWVDRYAYGDAGRTTEAPEVGGVQPHDVNGDGLYRDVTGDGSVGQSDVVRFFEHQHFDYMKRPEYFDYSGNGTVGHGDIVALFEDVATV